MKPPPTPLERELARAKELRIQVVNSFNLGRIKCWMDVLSILGYGQGEMEYVGWTKRHLLDTKPERHQVLPMLDGLVIQAHQNERIRQYDETVKRDNPFAGLTMEQLGEYAPPNGRGIQEDSWSNQHAEIQSSSNQQQDTNAVATKVEEVDKSKKIKPAETFPGWTPQSAHPKQKAKLWNRQEESASELYYRIIQEKKKGLLVQAATGSGKTYVIGALIRRLLDNDWSPYLHSMSPWPIVYVTKASIVEQTQRVLSQLFGIDVVNEVQVINIEQLRAKFGDMFINWETVIEAGTEHIKPMWKKIVHPVLFIWDECQILKNADTLQSLVAQDVNNIESRFTGNKHPCEVYQIFMSATPFTRVCEAKCFCVASKVPILDPYTGKSIPLTNANWPVWSKKIAGNVAPEEHSPAAIERLITHMLEYIVDIKGLRPQFHPHNKVEIIPFERAEDKAAYDVAWETYLKEKAKLEADEMLSGGQLGMMILAQFTIFRKKAENIRARTIATRMHHQAQEGWAAIAACCFKPTIVKIVTILIEEFHVPRHQISLIWGGAMMGNKLKTRQVKASVGSKMTEEERDKFIRNMVIGGADMAEIEELLNEDAGYTEETYKAGGPGYDYDKDKLEKYELGAQNARQRQLEIDRFQTGKSLYAIFTFKAGGVGLSLHHTDEWVLPKCRKHPNGDWVLVEDIPNVPVRPRQATLTPTFSAVELVQGLGRSARLTSLSDTPQTILFYAGTIEGRVAMTVSTKLKCLKKVVRAKESWESIILNPDKLTEEVVELPKEVAQPTTIEPPAEDDDDNVFLGGDDTEDE